MSLFASKYKPVTLKALFHQDAVTSIKKWVKELVSQKTNYRKILYIYGPVGCGKTTMINTIFKNFNLIDINSDELRSSDKIKDLVTCTLSNTHFKQQSFISTKPGKGTGNQNILLVDNIELCEKTIKQFTDLVTDYINIPIILLSNRKINIQTTKTLDITSLELQQVTRVELETLLQTISKKEKLNFTKLEINNIIDKSIFDLRQVFCILDQLSVSYKPINELLNYIDQKHADTDIHEKMNLCFPRILRLPLPHRQ
jgi:replication-associated recombination protein RarA